MINLQSKINITQAITVINKDTKEKEYFILKDEDDANWIKINESQYNQILRGNNNG